MTMQSTLQHNVHHSDFDDDGCGSSSFSIMPPPSKRYRIGTPECDEALRKGIIVLSLPEVLISGYDSHPTVAASESSSSSRSSASSSSRPRNTNTTTTTTRRRSPTSIVTTVTPPESVVLSSREAVLTELEDNDNDNDNIESTRNNKNKDIEEQEQEQRPPCRRRQQQQEPPQHNSFVQISVVSSDEGSNHSSEERMMNDDDDDGCSSMVANDSSSPTLTTTAAATTETKFLIPDPTLPSFQDIIGHGQVKLRIEELLLPMALPTAITNSILTGVRSMPASILLYGPPGCGKTKLARSIAGEAEAAFISIGPSDILSKYVGESEAAIKDIFCMARKEAKRMESQCAVLFLDEIDALGQSRGAGVRGGNGGGGEDSCSRRVLAELLLQLNKIADHQAKQPEVAGGDDAYDREGDDDHSLGAASQANSLEEDPVEATSSASPPPHVRVIVVAATNRPDDCDPALLRRFGIRLHCRLPTMCDRKRLLKMLLKDVAHKISKDELCELATALDGWSGSEIESLTREAAMAPVRECIRAAARKKRLSRRSSSSSRHACSEARGCLIEGFQTMRPVSLTDFEAAIEFWSENHSNDQEIIDGAGVQHYDSSSDSEDESPYEELPGFQRGGETHHTEP